MTQRYPSDGQGYIVNQYQNQSNRPTPSFSNNITHGLPTSSFPPSQALPPLSASNSTSTIASDPFLPSRIQQLHSSGVTSQNISSPPLSFPIYAPTASTHYFPQNGFATQPAMHTPQTSNPQTTSGPSRPAYTTAAPPNIQLPKIQPAPATNGDTKHASVIEKKGMQLLASAPPPPGGQETPPKHVVGSQGRRGILPSASGRPPASANPSANGGKNSPALAKDGDGKFPCPHCNKPYLHAKHLKRHMLRHTGVRPYECALCHDTFSRSDILKRHFQKCSVRRGNPTGENHLAYSRANKKAKQHEEESIAAGIHSMTTEQVASLPTYTASLDSPIGLAAMDIGQPSYERQEPLANQVTRTNGIRKVTGLGTPSNRGSTSSLNTFDPNNSAFSTGHVTPDSVTTSGAATPYTYPHEARSNLNSPADATFSHTMGLGLGNSRLSAGSSYTNGSLPHIVSQSSGRGSEIDWSHFQAYSSSEDFGGGQYHSGTNTPHHNFKNDAEFGNFDWSITQPKH